MTKDQFKTQINDLLEHNEFKKEIKYFSIKVFNSGAIDFENIKETDFSVAKCTLLIFFKNLSWNYRPLSKEQKRIYKNLSRFI